MAIGIKTGLVTGIKTGIKTGIAGGIYASWPTNNAELSAITGPGTSWNRIFTFDETSGVLVDKSGGENYTDEITPSYRQAGPTPGKFSVKFDTGQSDSFYSVVGGYQLGAGEFGILAVVKATNLSATRQIISNQGTNYWQLYTDPTGNVSSDVNDGTDTASVSIAAGLNDNNWHVILLTISRGAVERLRVAVDAITPVESNTTAVTPINPINRVRIGTADGGGGTGGDLQIAFLALTTTSAQSMRLQDSAIIARFKTAVGMT